MNRNSDVFENTILSGWLLETVAGAELMFNYCGRGSIVKAWTETEQKPIPSWTQLSTAIRLSFTGDGGPPDSKHIPPDII